MNLFGITSIIIFFSSIVFALSLYASNRESKVNRAWFSASLAIGFWGLGLYGVTSSGEASTALNWQYLLDVAAIFIPVLYVVFVLKFIDSDYKIFRIFSYIFATALAIFSFSPLFKIGVMPKYGFFWISPGAYYIIFPIYFTTYTILSMFFLVRAYIKSADVTRKAQIRNTLFAGLIGFGGGVTNFFPQVFNVYPFGNYFIILYVFLMSYGVLKYKLFSAKVLSAQLFSGALVLVFLFDLLQSDNLTTWLIKCLLFVLVTFFAILLVRGVYKEVEQREKIEKLAKELGETNDRQEKLIHFIGHEVKGYLTDGEYALATIGAGERSQISDELKNITDLALSKMREGVMRVEDILRSSNMKKGTIVYSMKPIELGALVGESLNKLKSEAENKKLSLEVKIDPNLSFLANIDASQFGEHVIRNLIDNSIKYTKSGSVIVGLTRKDDKIIFSVKDTGVGITADDMKHLFTEGGRGADSLKINVHSTGYGLFIAKGVTVAHGGRIWAESRGSGLGSTFFVELPVLG